MSVPAEVADDGTVEEMSQTKAIGLRFGILAVVVLVAALSFEFLGSVESIVGAVCSMSSSMLLPAFFFLRYFISAKSDVFPHVAALDSEGSPKDAPKS